MPAGAGRGPAPRRGAPRAGAASRRSARRRGPSGRRTRGSARLAIRARSGRPGRKNVSRRGSDSARRCGVFTESQRTSLGPRLASGMPDPDRDHRVVARSHAPGVAVELEDELPGEDVEGLLEGVDVASQPATRLEVADGQLRVDGPDASTHEDAPAQARDRPVGRGRCGRERPVDLAEERRGGRHRRLSGRSRIRWPLGRRRPGRPSRRGRPWAGGRARTRCRGPVRRPRCRGGEGSSNRWRWRRPVRGRSPRSRSSRPACR